MSSLEIRLLGPFEVRIDGKPLAPLRARKEHWLLALLALRLDQPVERDWLAGTLWPESAQHQALYNLRENLANLRRTLGPEAQRIASPSRQTLFLDLKDVVVDLAAFDAAIAHGGPQDLEQAVALYRGPLLEGWTEEWMLMARQQRERSYLNALESLAEQALAASDLEKTTDYLRRLITTDPLRESARRALMRALAATGNYAAAVQVYRELRLLLHQEYRTEAAPETTALFEQIRAEARFHAPPAPARTLHPPAEFPMPRMEPVGGAMPLDSEFYIVRPADDEFMAAIAARDSIVLVKGGRQVGKSSLLARGLQRAREKSARVALSDLQTLNERHFRSADAFCLALANTLALELELPIPPSKTWDPDLGASLNLTWYLRDQALKAVPEPLVWGMDEVDRLFTCPFASEVFGLFRSWHNRRSLDPAGPWSRLTLAIAYATEAHLFITDLNQSPFNVGTRLALEDFTPAQAAELNRLYGSPLRNEDQQERFCRLVGGQPYLTRRGLYEMVTRRWDFARLEAQADLDKGPFGDHLRSLLVSLLQDATLVKSVRSVLRGEGSLPAENFYRLRSAGILAGDSVNTARLRCHLYASYLTRRLLHG